METRKQLITIRVDYKCPECETGYLRPTGKVLMSSPAKYQHRCDNHECDYTKTFRGKKYPHLEYEETDVMVLTNGKTEVVLTEDQILQKIVDSINYNNFCARATLYPGLSIDEIPVLTVEEIIGKPIDENGCSCKNGCSSSSCTKR